MRGETNLNTHSMMASRNMGSSSLPRTPIFSTDYMDVERNGPINRELP